MIYKTLHIKLKIEHHDHQIAEGVSFIAEGVSFIHAKPYKT
jgi:hypothetical protein